VRSTELEDALNDPARATRSTLDWQDSALDRLVHERFGVPVNVITDSQDMALAEYSLETVASGPAIVARARRPGLDAEILDDLRTALEAGDARPLTDGRDDARNLPLRLGSEERILPVMPRPVHVVPADTSCAVPRGLALVGRLEPSGKLPVQLGDPYPVGHGL
jgi:hypothetical protein